MFEPLCDAVHANLIAGRCPWCGCEITYGEPLVDARVQKMLEEIMRNFPHWEPKPARPDFSDPEATAALLAIIEECGPQGKKAVPLLCAALAGKDWSVRLAAVNALSRIGPDAKAALPTLWTMIDDKDLIVREAVEDAIKNIDR